MEKEMIKFLEIAYKALSEEEKKLNKLFTLTKEQKQRYQKEHNGVCCLYETTFVYIIFKELLKNNFPYRIVWEYPYPSNKKLHQNLHSDLALLDNDDSIVALIEFKIWQQEHCKNIIADIDKLMKENSKDKNGRKIKKYEFIIEYGAINETKEDILKKAKDLIKENNNNITCIGNPKTFYSKYYFNGNMEDKKNINLYLFSLGDE